MHNKDTKKREKAFTKDYDSWKLAARKIRTKLKTLCTLDDLSNLQENIQACFQAWLSCSRSWINGSLNFALCKKMLKENVQPTVFDIKLRFTLVMQQDNDLKHTSKSKGDPTTC
ncbi:hypothetical protein ILYODFUR_038453 [Ilyodon furcidens]|uniref:Uncharacterized protein n=1 Tax=Ilyodon furcidens TaxID=33524 RepID=A0ABV0UCL8_9TELE